MEEMTRRATPWRGEAPKKRAQTMPRRPLPLPNSTIDAGGGWKDFRFFSRYLSWCHNNYYIKYIISVNK